MSGGRPVEWTPERQSEVGQKLLNWFETDHTRLFFKRFAHEEYDMSWQGLYAACKDNPEFSVAHARAKELQEERLAEGGLNGELNPQITGLTLKNVSGWRDRSESEVNATISISLADQIKAAHGD